MVYSSDHFIVGPLGHLEGDIHSYNISNKGRINGNLYADNKVALMQSSQLTGDIKAYQLIVDEGSNFEGRCKMMDAPAVKNPQKSIKTTKQSIFKTNKQNQVIPKASTSRYSIKKVSIFGFAFILLLLGVGLFNPEVEALGMT
jgi:cytoskeletal protein CcmA (bactofilin family)